VLLGLALLAAALGRPSTADAGTLQDRLRGYNVGAHRGGFWSVVQGTIPEYAASIDAGTDILEVDLRATKDGGVVISHSDTLSKHTICLGHIRDRTFADVMSCPLLPTGARLPSFEELLRWERSTSVVINAEFKDAEVIEPALQLIEKYDAWERVYFQTNVHYDWYAHARAFAPRVNLLVNVGNVERLRWALGLNDPHLVVIGLRGPMLNRTAIALVHRYGKAASANSWTGGHLEELVSAACDKFFAKGVDVVITNNVGSCVAQRDAMRKRDQVKAAAARP
jgi:glycerophosphoryl diester phosphodiesterase